MEMSNVPEEESELIERSKSGNDEAYAELVRRYRRRIFFVCLHITHQKDLAEDLTQETFIQAFRGLNGFKSQARFYTWLYRIAVNLSINAIKRMHAHPFLPILESTAAAPYSSQVELDEINLLIEKSLQQLPFAQRRVIELYDFEGKNHQEIARLLDINIGTVRSRLHYAEKNCGRYTVRSVTSNKIVRIEKDSNEWYGQNKKEFGKIKRKRHSRICMIASGKGG